MPIDQHQMTMQRKCFDLSTNDDGGDDDDDDDFDIIIEIINSVKWRSDRQWERSCRRHHHYHQQQRRTLKSFTHVPIHMKLLRFILFVCEI